MNFPCGRLNMDAEVGTILGPDAFGELLVVSAKDAGGVLVSRARPQDIEAAAQREPRSVTEHRLAVVRRYVEETR